MALGEFGGVREMQHIYLGIKSFHYRLSLLISVKPSDFFRAGILSDKRPLTLLSELLPCRFLVVQGAFCSCLFSVVVRCQYWTIYIGRSCLSLHWSLHRSAAFVSGIRPEDLRTTITILMLSVGPQRIHTVLQDGY